MTELQDFKSGFVCLDECISITHDLSVSALIGQGLIFDDEVDFYNGWVLRSSWNHSIFGYKVNVTFNFFNDCLRMFGFALVNDGGYDVVDLKKKHDELLRNLLGEPHKKNEITVSYEFLWGGITSQKDPRGGSCSIGVNWLEDRRK